MPDEDDEQGPRLAGADLMVTPICFGTSGLGDMPDTYGYSVGAERAARTTVEAIFAGPANFHRHVPALYGMGRSEERIGAVIRERGGLAAGLRRFDQARPGSRRPTCSTRRSARRSIEQSLKALGRRANRYPASARPGMGESPIEDADQPERGARRTVPHEGGGPRDRRRTGRRAESTR